MKRTERLEKLLAENMVQTALLRRQVVSLLAVYGQNVLEEGEELEARRVFLDAYAVLGSCQEDIGIEVARAIHTLELDPKWQAHLEARTLDWFDQFWGEVGDVLKHHQHRQVPPEADAPHEE